MSSFLSKRLLSFSQRAMSQESLKFKSLIYSSHDSQDCTNVLKVHNYKPKKGSETSIVLKTLAFPINPSDINQLEGVYPSKPDKVTDYSTDEPSAIAGNEGVFEVVSVPSSVSTLKPGDKVIPLQANFGTWSTYRTCDKESDLIKIEGVDIYTAATVAVNGCTAYQLVNDYIKWDPKGNDWLVQNAGTSSVSKIVTQIAKAKNINTLSVIRDRENFEEVAEILEKKYGATKVISETENGEKEFGKEVLPKVLGLNAQVKLALNSVGGKSCANIARKLSKDGLMLTYGGMSKQPLTFPTGLFIFKGLKSHGFWVTENSKRDPENKIKTVNEVIELYRDGKIISPKEDIRALEWDVNSASDEEVLQLITDGIKTKGTKNMVILKW
ncbi:Etr1 [Kluyveromyces lactis]|nr:Etr1 [Kluyveromyces lactis]